MRKILIVLAMVSLLVVSGCVIPVPAFLQIVPISDGSQNYKRADKTNWAKKDYAQERFNVDSYDCKKEAESMTLGVWIWGIPYAGLPMGIHNHVKGQRYYNQCLQSKGYMPESVVPRK